VIAVIALTHVPLGRYVRVVVVHGCRVLHPFPILLGCGWSQRWSDNTIPRRTTIIALIALIAPFVCVPLGGYVQVVVDQDVVGTQLSHYTADWISILTLHTCPLPTLFMYK
jgi:hypothetical protein